MKIPREEVVPVSVHAELARNLFLQGYNCSQAVVCAFCDVTGLEIDVAAIMPAAQIIVAALTLASMGAYLALWLRHMAG